MKGSLNPQSHSWQIVMLPSATSREWRTEKSQRLLEQLPAKHELDPTSTMLLKEILPKVVPLMEAINDKALNTGTFSESLKEALVHPLLKKINPDLLDKNYHPVSNLSFLSKAMECTVASQLVEYVDSSDLMEPNQSAYRRNHSTEATLLKVKSYSNGHGWKGHHLPTSVKYVSSFWHCWSHHLTVLPT